MPAGVEAKCSMSTLGGNKGLKIIGHQSKYGGEPSAEIRSRYNGFSEGETPDYTYEIVDEALPIWMRTRIAGVPAHREPTQRAPEGATRASPGARDTAQECISLSTRSCADRAHPARHSRSGDGPNETPNAA
jgi:hypothetical protein